VKKLQILASSPTQDLTTIDSVKIQLGVTDTSQDDYFASCIRYASSAISSYLGYPRGLGRETLLETFYGVQEEETILLDNWIDVAVAAVTDDAGPILPADWLNDSGQVYRLNSGRQALWWGAQIAIQYDAGYLLLDTLPFAIERACVMTVQSMSASRGRDPLLKRIEVPGVGTEDYWVGGQPGSNSALPVDALSLLEPFRRIRI
jgi:hypothetical protein